jgi:hypothetical protein
MNMKRNGVINNGIDATEYQLFASEEVRGCKAYSMACGFNHSKLKNRITMMLKRRTNNWARLTLLLFVPVVPERFMHLRVRKLEDSGAGDKRVCECETNSVQESELQQ